MDSIFDRAHELIDKAQEKMATATSQAAWSANQTLLIKGLESHLAELQREIDRLTTELGERTYQAWKAGADDPRIPALCGYLDDIKNRRSHVSADLAAARAATYRPPVVRSTGGTISVTPIPNMPPRPPALPPTAQSAPAAPPQYSAPTSPPPQSAPQASQPGATAPQPARPAGPPPVRGMPVPPKEQPAPPAPTPTASASAPSAPSAPQAPSRQARECPNCGHFVPASEDYCPACGFRVV